MFVLVTLVLVGTGTVVGFAVWAALCRWPLLDPSAPGGAVSAVKEEVREELGFVARRLDPQAATGLGLTVGVVVVIVGGALLAGLAFLVRSWSVLERIDRGAANWGSTNATQFSTSVVRVVVIGSPMFGIAVGHLVGHLGPVRRAFLGAGSALMRRFSLPGGGLRVEGHVVSHSA